MISQYMNAESMGIYKFEEFKKGCKALGCDDVSKWSQILVNRIYKELTNKDKLKSLYNYVFDYVREEGKTNLLVESACTLWDLFFGVEC